MDTKISIVGLGPGDPNSLSLGTLDRLKKARKAIFRTGRHPVADFLVRMGIEFDTLDYLYEKYEDFNQVYDEIALAVINETLKGPVVFAVPGHPQVGEESVRRIVKMAREKNITCEIEPAMSFLDPVLTSLAIDISDGLKLIDGLDLARPGSFVGRPDPRIQCLIMQVYSPMVASEVKLSLMDYYPDEHPVKVIRAAGVLGQERIQELPLFELDRLSWIDHLTSVYVPPFSESKPVMSRFPLDALVDIMERLRGEAGCPWDKEQTNFTLKKYLVEETYEVLDAIDEGNMYKFCEELGDLLLQIAFHAQIARESGFFDINDVVESIAQKLVRRHPHIFGSVNVSSSQEVSANWEEIKKGELKEKGEIRRSLLDGIPKTMPTLIKAEKLQQKAAKVGFDWPDYTGALDKVIEETAEIKEAISANDRDWIKGELGDLLFAAVNLARLLKIDPDEALALTNNKFKERFMYMEEKALETHAGLETMNLEALDRLWEEAKRRLKCKKNQI